MTINLQDLDAARRQWQSAERHYLDMCAQHDCRMVGAGAVKGAHAQAQALRAEYDRLFTEYQQ